MPANTRKRITRYRYHHPGRLVPPDAKHLRGRSMRLLPGETVAWHTTGKREEVIIVLAGSLRLDLADGGRVARTTTLSVGHCVFLPQAVAHRVVNRFTRIARYLYFTAS